MILQKKVAIAVICKNELDNISQCLANSSLADSVFVLDTGSTDNTYNQFVALVAENKLSNVHLYQHKFDTIDFSLFRNKLLELMIESGIEYDYIFYVDMDEVLPPDWRIILNQYLHLNPDILTVLRHEYPDGAVTQLNRIFKNKPGSWCNQLHEGFIFNNIENLDMVVLTAYDLTIDHFSKTTPEKMINYLTIIENNIEQKPEHYLYFYFIHYYSFLHDHSRVIESYYQYIDVIETKLSEIYQHLIYRYVLVSIRHQGGVLDFVLLDKFLRIRNKSTLFTACRYCAKHGHRTEALSLFSEYETFVETDELKFKSYRAEAYDPASIQIMQNYINK